MSRKQSVFSYAELQKMQARPREKKVEEARGIGMDLVEKLDEAEFIIEMLLIDNGDLTTKLREAKAREGELRKRLQVITIETGWPLFLAIDEAEEHLKKNPRPVILDKMERMEQLLRRIADLPLLGVR